MIDLKLPKDGGPVAPVETSLGPGRGTLHFNGLSVRQAYKMVALPAAMTSGTWTKGDKPVNNPKTYAWVAACIADALLDEDREFAGKNQS